VALCKSLQPNGLGKGARCRKINERKDQKTLALKFISDKLLFTFFTSGKRGAEKIVKNLLTAASKDVFYTSC